MYPFVTHPPYLDGLHWAMKIAAQIIHATIQPASMSQPIARANSA